MQGLCITLGQVNARPAQVPNEFPRYAGQYRIAVVGEAPGPYEVEDGKPFTGGSGRLLWSALHRVGLSRADFFVGNVSQSPVVGDDDKPERNLKRTWKSQAVQDGLEQLRKDIETHDPICILLLGGLALKAAFPKEDYKITNWRGSILQAAPDSIFAGRKVIPTIHPASVMRLWEDWPLFCFDLERFKEECGTATISHEHRNYQLDVSPDLAIQLLQAITDVKSPVALDIEGGIQGMSCVSFAQSRDSAFIVPLATYGDQDKKRVLRALHRFLASSTPKVLQNSLYDNFVLSWTYKSPIRNVVWDTMLSGWEIYPELPKGLDTQASIWTRHPYYKMGRNSTDNRTLHAYCCTDSALTYEIYEKHRQYFRGRNAAYGHFKFNMSLLPALLYMEQSGINYDRQLATSLLDETRRELATIQSRIDGYLKSVWEKHGSRGPAPASLNVNSPKQVCQVLYDRLPYPKQHPKKGLERDTTRVTANVDALLDLRKKYNSEEDQILEDILQYRKYDGLRETLEITTDKDGRVRCGYNVVGTDTGRLSCYTSPTGSGANLTTITKKLRRLYLPDPGYWFFQCDLSGADGWTVAAHCARHGDETMLLDYHYGIKPAKVIVLMLRQGKEVNRLTREELKALCKTLKTDDHEPDFPVYFASKRVQHGTNYGLGTATMSDQILKDSYKYVGKTLVIAKHECQVLQDLYLTRYPGVPMWQRWVRDQIDKDAQLSSASGHTRRFFGRYKDHQTYRAAYSQEPQANTTYVTNLALYKLWTDKSNRIPSDQAVRSIHESRHGTFSSEKQGDQRMSQYQFRIPPRHHVHDALCGQFRKDDLEFALSRIPTYFDNPIEIAGRKITIPFEGAYGPSWGELGKDYGGGEIRPL